jgi:long-subunit acyl-CoA synthetase (AMP-forming)
MKHTEAEPGTMHLTDLPRWLSSAPRSGTIITFEKGKAIRRTYAQLGQQVRAAVVALRRWGVLPGMRVGVRAPNCYEWLVFDLALVELRAVTVAFTDDFADWSPEGLAERYSLGLLLLLRGGTRNTRVERPFVAYMDGSDADNENVTAIDGERGDDHEFDTPGLIFSTGSSGGVKGMVLNRRGIDATISAFSYAVAPVHTDCVLLFLPISNYQQRLICYTTLWNEADLVITDPLRLFRALKELRPTILVAPPMFYEGFSARFQSLPQWKRGLARAGATALRAVPSRTLRGRAARLLFREVYEALGGRMRFMITGMAPTNLSTLELFANMQLPLYETYGMIECGSVAFNRPGAHRIGSVGRLLPGTEIDIGKHSEILVRKEHPVTQGYFECAEGEAERTYLADGRIATGDCGRLDSDGFLYIVGRIREMIVTSGGEKAHPEVLEAEIDRCADVGKSVVFGGGRHGLIAVVVLRDPTDAGARQRIEQHVERMNAGRSRMTVERLVFSETPFSREDGLLRPNLKLDRRRIEQTYIAPEARQRAG